MIMEDSHVTMSCIFLSNLSEKTMSSLQKSAPEVKAEEQVKPEIKDFKHHWNCHCEVSTVDNWVYLHYIKP